MTAPPVEPDPGDLDIRTVPGPDCCTITVSGEVDARSAPVLGDRLLEVLRRPDVTVVELDLRRVTFLGSPGLTALVVAHRSALAAGRSLRMRCGATRAVRRPLEITGLSAVFTLVAEQPEECGR
jgi:anti-sigma B factor antagonist